MPCNGFNYVQQLLSNGLWWTKRYNALDELNVRVNYYKITFFQIRRYSRITVHIHRHGRYKAMHIYLRGRTIPVASAASAAPTLRHELYARHGHRRAGIDAPDARAATERALFRPKHVLSLGIRRAGCADDHRPG